MTLKLIVGIALGLALFAVGVLVGRKHKNVSDAVAKAASSAEAAIQKAADKQ